MLKRVKVLILKEWQEALSGSKTIWIGTVALPIFFLGYSVYQMMSLGDLNDPESASYLIQALFNVALLYFIMLPMIIPHSIAVYAIMGEKDQKSLESLLTTPLTTLEFFAGKVLASVIPAVVITWGISGLFWLLMGIFLPPQVISSAWAEFGLTWTLTVFLFAPLASILVTNAAMAIATRVSDFRAAQLLSSFVMLPLLLGAMYFVFRQALAKPLLIGLFSLIALVIDLALLVVSIKLFQREEILTRWR